MAAATYRFLPWSRRGLAALAPVADSGRPLPQHVAIGAGLTVTGGLAGEATAMLYGPGEVTGLDPRVIVRTDPRPGTTDAESNYLAAIEFDLPELPWLFTPARPTGDRLRPWLVLVVLDAGGPAAVAAPVLLAGSPLPRVELTAEQAAAQLPDLAESWCWAHSQLLAEEGDPATTAQALDSDPLRNLSRLICPRRLEPMRAYHACLVPAFDLGVERGLGQTPDPAAQLEPAWNAASPARLVLPVYHHWQFATGPAGDFEALVRALQPVACPADVGFAPMHLWRGTATQAGASSAPLALDGVLRPEAAEPATLDDVDTAFIAALKRALDPLEDQAFAIPLYGAAQAGCVRLDGDAPRWLAELNLDPRTRVAAGLGVATVRANQDRFVQACWYQAGSIGEANALIDRGQLSGGALARLHRQIAALPAARRIAVAGPVLDRMEFEAGTLAGAVGVSSLPDAISSAALRRLASPNRRVVRSAARKRGAGRAFDLAAAAQRSRPAAGLSLPGPPAQPGGEALPRAAPLPPKVKRAVQSARAALKLDAPVRTVAAKPFDLGAAGSAIVARLDPRGTVAARIGAMVTRGEGVVVSEARLDRIDATPEIAEAAYLSLAAIDPGVFLHGADALAENSATLVETNARFIEAYMVGLNHEMNRELSWRGFPVDPRGTPFQRFWDREGGACDIPPIAEWNKDSPLGSHAAGGEGGWLVFLARTAVLRRHPNSVLAAWRGETRGGRAMLKANPRSGADPSTADYLPASFFGRIGDDIGFAGFALTRAEAEAGAGWFFVIEQQLTEPRFGFDQEMSGEQPAKPASWLDARWIDTGTAPGDHLRAAGLLAGHKANGIEYARDAAHFAAAAMQRPFRVAIHARHLLAAERSG